MKKFYFFVFITFFVSCSSSYYLSETATNIPLYYEKNAIGNPMVDIPEGEEVIIKGKGEYRKVKYLRYVGWAQSPYLVYSQRHKYRGSFRISPKTYGYSNSKVTINIKRNNNISTPKKSIQTKKKYSSTSSNYDINSSGVFHVKGYYRKDGTYVRPHTRSFPNSKKSSSNSSKVSKSKIRSHSSRIDSSKKKKVKSSTSRKTYYSPSSTGRVKVRGYYRKDGTYVRPHTRRKPRRRY